MVGVEELEPGDDAFTCDPRNPELGFNPPGSWLPTSIKSARIGFEEL
jgi:hypothetical protein